MLHIFVATSMQKYTKGIIAAMKNKTLVPMWLLIFLLSVGSTLLLSGCAATTSQSETLPAPAQDQAQTLPEAGDARPTPQVSPTPQMSPTPQVSPTLATPTPQPITPTATPTEAPVENSPTPEQPLTLSAPTQLIIPAIGLDVPIIDVGWSIVDKEGQQVSEWDVPDWRAAGWLNTSARIGGPGNTVIVGHQNVYGQVFADLEYLKEGDEIQVQAGSETRKYVVALRTIVLDKDQPLEVRRENARWIALSDDERLTFVTCWPRNDNTHRLILVALPVP